MKVIPSSRILHYITIALLGSIWIGLSNYRLIDEKFSFLEIIGILGLVCLLISFPHATKGLPFFPWPVLIVLLLSATSFLSSRSLGSAKDLAAYLMIFVIGYAICVSIDTKTIFLGILLGGLFTALLSIILGVFYSSLSLGPNGELIGPFYHWNSLGMCLAMSFPSGLALLPQASRKQQLLITLGLSTIVIAIIESQSKTTLATALATLAVFLMLILLKRHPKHKRVIYISFVSILILSGIFWTQILQLIGKEPSFTGRIPIWNSLAPLVQEQPIIGYGWSRLFPVDSVEFQTVVGITSIPARHAHNDLMNWAIMAGVPCALIILGSLIYGLFISIRHWLCFKNNESLWVALCFVALSIGGLTEISTFLPTGFFLLTVGVTTLNKLISETKSF